MERFTSFNADNLKARIVARQDCILSGIDEAIRSAETIGVTAEKIKAEGDIVKNGETIAVFSGDPVQLVSLKDHVICYISKASAVASAARQAVLMAKDKIDLVVSVLKVMPEQRDLIRQAARTGGARTQLAKPPAVLLDKNIISVFGSVSEAIANTDRKISPTIVVSIRGGRKDSVEAQTRQAVHAGADILFLDGGNIYDLDRCVRELKLSRSRTQVKLAYAGGLTAAGIPDLVKRGVDIAVIGRNIVDADMMDFSYDVYYGG